MVNKSKIALLHPQMHIRGGAIKMMLLAAGELQKQGHDVHIFSFSRDESCFWALQSKVDHIHIFSWTFRKVRLAWHLRQFDMVIAGNPPMHAVAVLARFFGSYARIVWWHHHIPWYSTGSLQIESPLGSHFIRKLKGFFEKKCIIPHISTHWVCSQYVQKALMEYCGCDSEVIYPVLDDVFVSGDFPTPQNASGQVMITHGRLVDGKGYETVFSVYDEVKKSFPDLIFVVIWDGQLRQQYQSHYQADQNVHFLGQCDTQTIRDQYAQADVAVFSSTIDAFGMSVLESQAMWVATVVMDVFGSSEAVVDPQFWYLVADAKAMTAKICDLLWWNTQKGKYLKSTHNDVYFQFWLSHFSELLAYLMHKTDI